MAMEQKTYRVIFMGSCTFSLAIVKGLWDFVSKTPERFKLIGVCTKPPAPRGRGQHLEKSVVHVWAHEHGIPCVTPLSFRPERDPTAPEAINALRLWEPDLAIVASYGLILPREVLEIPALGCINVHTSLLPRWRGAAPVVRALLEGDTISGVSIMKMDEGMDTGPILAQKTVAIDSTTTSPQLHEALAVCANELLPDILVAYVNGTCSPVAQSDCGVTLAPKVLKEEGVVSPLTHSALLIERKIRALNPWPGVWIHLPVGQLKLLSARVYGTDRGDRHAHQNPIGALVRVPSSLSGKRNAFSWAVVCQDQSLLELLVVQPKGGRPMPFPDFLNGVKEMKEMKEKKEMRDSITP